MDDMECYRSLKLTHCLYYGGLLVMILSILIGTAVRNSLIMVVLGVAGICAAFGGIIFAAVQLRCPECNGSLMSGGRVPGKLPNFCPHCGKQL